LSESLDAFRVLVVEDEMMVSMLIEDYLADLGCEVAGPAATLEEAMSMAEQAKFDAAVLDLNLAGDRTFPVADKLVEMGVPFAFATGYGQGGLRDQDQHRPVLQKPFVYEDLQAVVEQLKVQARA
jgi:CheY-like chemotaxis protein